MNGYLRHLVEAERIQRRRLRRSLTEIEAQIRTLRVELEDEEEGMVTDARLHRLERSVSGLSEGVEILRARRVARVFHAAAAARSAARGVAS